MTAFSSASRNAISMSVPFPGAHRHFLIKSISLSTKGEIAGTSLGKASSIWMQGPPRSKSLCPFRAIARSESNTRAKPLLRYVIDFEMRLNGARKSSRKGVEKCREHSRHSSTIGDSRGAKVQEKQRRLLRRESSEGVLDSGAPRWFPGRCPPSCTVCTAEKRKRRENSCPARFLCSGAP